MNIVFGLAGIVIKELYRRKDFYVLFVMTALITLVMGSVRFFNDAKIAHYLKEICLLLIWVSALVIAIGTTARQIPSEKENRTIFPLLAKPVSRGQVILGKFLGCWLACGIALAVFYLFFGVISASREQELHLATYFQALCFQWAMLAIVIALCLLGSIVLSAPSSNATICFVVVIGVLLLGRYLNNVAIQQTEPVRSIVYTLYFILPHLEWYDIRDFVIYGRAPLAWGAWILGLIYAALYSAALLFGSWLLFRRKALNT